MRTETSQTMETSSGRWLVGSAMGCRAKEREAGCVGTRAVSLVWPGESAVGWVLTMIQTKH